MYALRGHNNPPLLTRDCFVDDDNRIVLKPLADASDCQRDYINACYVDVSLFSAYQSALLTVAFLYTCLPTIQGFSIANKFIATQGEY